MFKVLFRVSVLTEETGDGWEFSREGMLPFVPSQGMRLAFCNCCSCCDIEGDPYYEVHNDRFVVDIEIDFHFRDRSREQVVEHFVNTGWTEEKDENDWLQTLIDKERAPLTS